MAQNNLFRRIIAIPQDHGSWVFLFSPLLIGLFAGENFSRGSIALIVTAVLVFLIRQPVSMAAKVLSGRRPRSDLSASIFWIGLYGGLLVASMVVLIYLGYSYLLLLAIPGLVVFAWHLYLVSKRKERGQAGVEILATGVLALSAPAAYWVGLDSYSPIGWWLWILCWIQSAASIVYAYLRLEQRALQVKPELPERFRMARSVLAYSTFNLIATLLLSIADVLPYLIFTPYLIQWLETIYGTVNPAIGIKPTKIGIRQLVVSTLFTIVFILAWRYS